MFRHFGGNKLVPQPPADVQVTHTTLTRRSALYASLAVHWGPGDPVFTVVVVVVASFGGWGVCRGRQNPVQCPTTLKAMQTTLALRPALFAPLFASPVHWEPGGVRGRLCGVVRNIINIYLWE